MSIRARWKEKDTDCVLMCVCVRENEREMKGCGAPLFVRAPEIIGFVYSVSVRPVRERDGNFNGNMAVKQHPACT